MSRRTSIQQEIARNLPSFVENKVLENISGSQTLAGGNPPDSTVGGDGDLFIYTPTGTSGVGTQATWYIKAKGTWTAIVTLTQSPQVRFASSDPTFLAQSGDVNALNAVNGDIYFVSPGNNTLTIYKKITGTWRALITVSGTPISASSMADS